jgi:hypothetical protein
MSRSDNWRKHALECMRFEADCRQLVAEVHSTALQAHFARMAIVWSTLAARGESAHTVN